MKIIDPVSHHYNMEEAIAALQTPQRIDHDQKVVRLLKSIKVAFAHKTVFQIKMRVIFKEGIDAQYSIDVLRKFGLLFPMEIHIAKIEFTSMIEKTHTTIPQKISVEQTHEMGEKGVAKLKKLIPNLQASWKNKTTKKLAEQQLQKFDLAA